MRKKMRKVICAILIILLLCICIITKAEVMNDTSQESTEEKTDKSQLEQLQEENKKIQEQIEQSMKELTIVEEELSQNLLQVQELDTKIQNSEEELGKLNDEVSVLSVQIKEIEKEVKEKRQEYNSAQELLDERMIAIYEGGEIQYLDILLGSKSITEFLSRYFMIVELYEYDTKLLEEVNEGKTALESQEKILKTQEEDFTEKIREQQKKSQMLENTKKARELYISKLSEEEQNIQKGIEEYKQQVAEIEYEIRKLSNVINFGENYTGEQMIWPIPGYRTITSRFGMRVHPITGLYRLHTGTDVGAPTGTDFIAMATGVVVKAEYNSGYGNMVILDHGGGVQTLYAHGSQILVNLGDTVKQGEPVLKVGTTGYSTGPHAHFEIRIDGSPVNPMDYVDPDNNFKAIVKEDTEVNNTEIIDEET